MAVAYAASQEPEVQVIGAGVCSRGGKAPAPHGGVRNPRPWGAMGEPAPVRGRQRQKGGANTPEAVAQSLRRVIRVEDAQPLVSRANRVWWARKRGANALRRQRHAGGAEP